MKFYAVIAGNGVAVTNSWDKAKTALIYLSGQSYAKKFNYFWEANEYALAHLEKIAAGKRLPTDLPMNLTVHVSALEDLIIPFTVSGRPQNLVF